MNTSLFFGVAVCILCMPVFNKYVVPAGFPDTMESKSSPVEVGENREVPKEHNIFRNKSIWVGSAHVGKGYWKEYEHRSLATGWGVHFLIPLFRRYGNLYHISRNIFSVWAAQRTKRSITWIDYDLCHSDCQKGEEKRSIGYHLGLLSFTNVTCQNLTGLMCPTISDVWNYSGNFQKCRQEKPLLFIIDNLLNPIEFFSRQISNCRVITTV